jgi:GDP-D-mannose dehydratase
MNVFRRHHRILSCDEDTASSCSSHHHRIVRTVHVTLAQARMLLTSTSEVYGDPQISPQKEDYWGHVNPIGPRACYDEGERCDAS